MSAYNRLLKKGTKKATKNNRITTQSQDSDISQRTDNQNVFLQTSNQYIVEDSRYDKSKPSKIQKNIVSNGKIPRKDSQSPQKNSKVAQSQNQLQLIDDERIPQGQDDKQDQDDAELSLTQSYKLYTGQNTRQTNYPFTKTIAINNNNDEENAVSRRHLRDKQKCPNNPASDYTQFHSVNSIKSSGFLLFIHIFFNFLTCWQFHLYAIVMVASFLVQKFVFYNNAQYVGEPYILLIIVIVYVVVYLLMEFFIVRKRRSWNENQDKFKVYFHDGVSAEWSMLQANQIKPGHVYKVPGGSKFPTDCILLHSAQSMISIDQSETKSILPSSIYNSLIKQTVIKSETIVLPISGFVQYQLSCPQLKQKSLLQGSLQIQEPISIKHMVTTDNFVQRNCVNLTTNEILCLALEVGSHSVNMKGVEYPFMWKDNEVIVERSASHLLTVRKFIFYFLVVSCIGFILLAGIGILVGYLTDAMIDKYYYWGSAVPILHLVFYHFTNFVILIPIFLEISVLLYYFFAGLITESNISSRMFQLSQAEVENSLSQTTGNINIKDYTLIPALSQSKPVIVLGIQLFKEKKSFELQKIVVKEIKFDFDKHRVDDQLFDEQQRNVVKYFMAVALLTSAVNQSKQSQQSHSDSMFDTSVRKMAKQHFSFKLTKQKNVYTVTGPLENVFSEGNLSVIHYFTVKGCAQYPFTISFFEIPAEKAQDNPERRVLCLIRGDPETILMKTYGKKIQLLTESDKLHQEGGYQTHFIGKFTALFHQAESLKDLWQKLTTSKAKFYGIIQPLFKKIEPMGLLAFQNQYSQQNPSSIKPNQFLNLSLLNQTSNLNEDLFSSSNLPPLIILSPQPSPFCSHPEFQSVNVANRILTNPQLFNFTHKQVSDKILYDPIPVQQMVQKLSREKVCVFNGWDRSNIEFMLNGMKEKGLTLISILEKDQQLYLSKLCDYSVSRTGSGDVQKYTDITIEHTKQTPKIMTFLTLLQLLNHDSNVMYEGLYNIVLIHVVKFSCYFTIEALNFFYTLGSGISLLRLPLYAITQIIVLLDVFYHLNAKDGAKFVKKENAKPLPSLLWVSIKTILFSILGMLILIYSSIVPHSSQGTPVNSVFCILQVHLFITHLIIFSKLNWSSEITWFRIIIILIQLLTYYIGILIVSQISLYEFNGVLVYTFSNKLYLVSIIIIWTFLNFNFGQSVFGMNRQTMSKKDQKYEKIKRVNKETNLEIIDVEA